jgi:acetyl-CoA carboxylase biotin carboxyl carrier protein
MDEITTPITGTIYKIEVEEGDEVEEGTEILILEAMDVEVPIEVPEDCVISEILVEEGQSVTEGEVLVRIETI